ncbi:MAG: energy-coupling factor transporter transmembrane component T [Candidatus Jettenia sp. CY-1]|nr:MAG: energy-coupling factor transporter transmembrane component T [Candidatus Jettenia sp. CY-1]
MNISPPATRTGTILILLILLGLGLLDNLFYLLLCLLIMSLFVVLVVRKAFKTVWHCKEALIFFILTGATLLWTEEGRSLAPVLTTKMLSMWLWTLTWISWVGFERILLTFEKLKVPSVLIHIVAFTARFLPILLERLKMMLAAQASRGAKKGIHPLQLRNLAGGIGCLLLASFEQAENIERAMQSRGFSGILPFLAEDTVVVPYGGLFFLFIFMGIVWFGVVCNVLCYPCPEFIFQISKWRAGAF